MTTNDDLIERAVQASIDAGLAANGEHGVSSARFAARHILTTLTGQQRRAPAVTAEMVERFIVASSTAGGATEECVHSGLTAALSVSHETGVGEIQADLSLTDETQGVKREDVEAWLHPRAGWASTAHHIVMNHCRIDGTDGGPIPLVRLSRAETAEASLAAMREDAALHVGQLSELLKLIKEHWIDYDHVFSISVSEADKWAAALSAGATS